MISLKSKITRKLLNYFFLNPKESLYVNELSRNLALDKRNLDFYAGGVEVTEKECSEFIKFTEKVLPKSRILFMVKNNAFYYNFSSL